MLLQAANSVVMIRLPVPLPETAEGLVRCMIAGNPLAQRSIEAHP